MRMGAHFVFVITAIIIIVIVIIIITEQRNKLLKHTKQWYDILRYVVTLQLPVYSTREITAIAPPVIPHFPNPSGDGRNICKIITTTTKHKRNKKKKREQR
uniref:Uncharacterized protein n=1 Tax=Trypanosoma congolense (strain IL3000) TaxID=1068625 RepID=G0UKX5_TRYCI|nr:hypothetical protein, unlikely [Trypanosoma congolense IL3000]